jgi:hypothetical protein
VTAADGSRLAESAIVTWPSTPLKLKACPTLPGTNVEALEGLAKHYSPYKLLHEYSRYFQGRPKDRDGSFRSFINNRGIGKDLPISESFVGQLYHKAMDQAASELERRQADLEGADAPTSSIVQ